MARARQGVGIAFSYFLGLLRTENKAEFIVTAQNIMVQGKMAMISFKYRTKYAVACRLSFPRHRVYFQGRNEFRRVHAYDISGRAAKMQKADAPGFSL